MVRRTGWWPGLLVRTLWVCNAAADAPAPDAAPGSDTSEGPAVAQAREAFLLGTALARQGQWIDALAAFERSDRMRSHPVTTYNIGYCERALGHFTRARKMFREALRDHDASRGGQLTPDLLEEAKSYLPEVERRLATAVVTLTPAQTEVAVDGRPLEVVSDAEDQRADPNHGSRLVLAAGTRDPGRPEVPPAATFDLLLDPGRHVFVLSRPGSPDVVIEKSFEAGGTSPLALTSEEEVKPAAPAPPSAAARAPDGPDYTWPILAYGVGASGIVVGSIFGIATLSKKGDLQDQCETPDTCPEAAQPDIDAANLNATISTIGFGVGIAGVGLGTYLLLTSEQPSKRERVQRERPTLRAWVGPASAGLRGRF
jgi:hypothetical protein